MKVTATTRPQRGETVKVTADTITTEQIREVWRIGAAEGVHGNPDIMHAANVARNEHADFNTAERRAARAQCATIWNAHHGATSPKKEG